MQILAFILSVLCCPLALAVTPQASKGVMDLRSMDASQMGKIQLEGEWQFYWKQLVDPQDLADSPFTFQEAPKDWTFYKIDDESLPWRGFATQSLRVLLPEGQEDWVLRVAPIVMAGRVYVNGELLVQEGSPGENEIPGHHFEPKMLFFPKDIRELSIVVQYSNAHIIRSGYAEFQLGPRTAMLRSELYFYSKNIFLLGGIFLMGIYHLCLFILRPKDRSNLFFVGVCAADGIFIYVATGIVNFHWPQLSSETAWDLFFLSWYSGGMFFALFTQSVFPKYFSMKFAYLTSAISLGSMLIVALTPMRDFLFLYKIQQFWNAVLVAYTGWVCYRAGKAGEKGPGLFMLATMIFFASMVNDMLVSTGMLKNELQAALGFFIFLFFQSILLSRHSTAAFHRLEIAEGSIRILNESLAEQVRVKTREIRAILQHIKLGIFTLATNDKNEIVLQDDYSNHLEELLNKRNLGGLRFFDAIMDHSNLNSDQKSMLKSTILASLGEDEIAFMANEENLVREFQLQVSGGKTIEIDWEAIPGSNGQTEQMLVSMRDVTNIRELQQQSIDQQKELEYISEIVNTTPEQFAQFTDMSYILLDENERLVKANSTKNIEVIKILFINMHTIKGNARSYHFYKMTGILHDAEQAYAELLLQEDQPWKPEALLRDLFEVRNILGIYDRINTEKLGRKRDRNLIEMDRRVIEQRVNSLNLLDTTRLDPDSRTVIEDTKRTFNQFFFTQALDVFESILASSERIARDLQKEAPIIKIDDPGVSLSQEAQDLCRQIFSHLVRNSMDHGIENAQERVKSHKRPTGALLLDILPRTDGILELNYRDDGRGLDLQKLAEIGMSRGLLIKGREYTSEQIAELIFENGLSTADRLTEISGRGVGMDAVRKYLEKEGGRIDVVLEEQLSSGRWAFSFRILVPQKFYTLAA